VYSSPFSRFIGEAFKERPFSRKIKKEMLSKTKSTILEAKCRWLPEKTKNSTESRRKEREEGPKGGRSYVEGCKKDHTTTNWL